MADTAFSSGTVVASTWLQDVNNFVYRNQMPTTSNPTGAGKFLAMSQFSGADNTGVGDSTSAINVALALSATLRVPLMVDGRFRHTAQIVVPAFVHIIGLGWASDSTTGNRSFSCFIKDFNGLTTTPFSSAGFLFSGANSSTDGVQYDSVVGRSGHGVQVTGERVRLFNGSTTNSGAVGVRIGATELGAATFNANCGTMQNWVSLSTGSHGVWVDHTNTDTSVTYPLGAPDVNAWTFSHIVVGKSTQGCAGDGFRTGNAIDNVHTDIVAQNNTGNAIHFTTSARGHKVFGYYCELNTAGGMLFDSGARQNLALGGHSIIGSQPTVDNDGSNTFLEPSNLVPSVGMFYNQLRVGNPAAAGFADYYGGPVDVNYIDAWRLRASQPSGSRGRFTLQTKTNGGALTDRIVLDEALAYIINLTNGLLLGKTAYDTTTAGIQLMDGALGRINIVNTGTGSQIVEGFYNGNGFVGGITTSGTTTTYATSSDERLKKDIVPLKSQGDVIDAIKVREFSFKKDPDIKVKGFIAQELMEQAPEAVVQFDEFYGVDASKLIPILVKEIQDLRTRVKTLENG